MGGLSEEREVSLETGAAVAAALRRRQHDTVEVDVDRRLCRVLAEQGVEVAFIALHGRFGEDGCVQGLLELLQIPYTGSGVVASALAMDKLQSKRLFEQLRIPTVPWRHPATERSVGELGLPVVIKPRGQGSSVGVTIVEEPGEVAAAIHRAGGAEASLVERYVDGRELQVAVMGQGEQARCLGTVEVVPGERFYTYAAKYSRDDTRYLVPAPVDAALTARLSELAVATHRAMDCCGATRCDFMWSGEGEPLLLELNTVPGMTSHSLLPMIAEHAGMSYDDLVEAMLSVAGLHA